MLLPNYKEIMALIKKGSTLEAQEQIIRLREASLELQEENQNLKIRVKELENSIALKSKVIWEKPSYWLLKEDKKDGPFCQRCFDSDEKLVRLQGGMNEKWSCRECDSSYYGINYKAKQNKTKPHRRIISSGINI